MAPQGDGALRAEMQAFDATQDWAVAEAWTTGPVGV